MWRLLFPEWDGMSTGRKAVGLLAPLVGGVATGLSGTGTTFFYIFNTWGAISAAISFGAEHRTRRDTLLRAVVNGVLYSLALVIAVHASGNQRVEAGWLLPDSDVALFLLMASASIPLHLLGTRFRNALDPLPEPLPEPVATPAPVVPVVPVAAPVVVPVAAPQPVAQPLTRRERLREPALR